MKIIILAVTLNLLIAVNLAEHSSREEEREEMIHKYMQFEHSATGNSYI